jgi:hypothetical protein
MFDQEEIENLRHVYNKKFKGNIQAGSSEQVWKEILNKFATKCRTGKSKCIISHMIGKPKAPDSWITKPTDWLSDQDINKLEDEFEILFKGYKFLGCVSIDFDLKSPEGKCIVDTLCSTNLKDLYKQGKDQIGIIFNTDVHTGPGEHWMALYCDLRPEVDPRITFFDSYGRSPESEIKRLMLRWKLEWDATKIHDKEIETTYNITKHQYKNSECGVYCIYFLTSLLDGKTFEEVINNIISDDKMNAKRKEFFSKAS